MLSGAALRRLLPSRVGQTAANLANPVGTAIGSTLCVPLFGSRQFTNFNRAAGLEYRVSNDQSLGALKAVGGDPQKTG